MADGEKTVRIESFRNAIGRIRELLFQESRSVHDNEGPIEGILVFNLRNTALTISEKHSHPSRLQFARLQSEWTPRCFD